MMSIEEKNPQVGQVLGGRYRIVAEGADHDLGTTYKAYDIQQGRLAVILLLDSRFGSEEDVLDRLVLANEAIADLAQPELLPFDHVGLVDGRLYLARAHVEYQSLTELLVGTDPLEVDAALEIAILLCEALAPAHRAGLVHGGLSSHCVLVGDGGHIAVTDSGLVPALRPAAKSSVQSWGRAPYLSPEHAAGEAAIPASDVYVVGLLLYEMLSGRQPFDVGDPTHLALRHLRQEPLPLLTLVPQLPLPLVRIVHKALSKEPAARYRNAAQLAHILRSQVEVEAGSQEDLYLEAQPVAPLPDPAMFRRPEPGGDPYILAPSAAPPLMSQRETYYIQDVDDWTRDQAGPDWLMIALIVAALIAVLGLIPLWRSVYRHYAVPAPGATPSSHFLPGGEEASILSCTEDQENEVRGMAELDDSGLVWYNFRTLNRSLPGTVCAEAVRFGRSTGSGKFSRLGVQITVLGAPCIKL